MSGRRGTQRCFRLLPWLVVLAGVLAGCAHQRPAEEVHAELMRKLPRTLPDRAGWAQDIQAAISALEIEPNSAHLCAVIAVVEQESNFHADPVVPGLPRIARRELQRRADGMHVPDFLVQAALRVHSADGRTYSQRIDALRTEQELSELFEELTDKVPLGRRLLAGFNPVHTAGPMQVSIAFAQRHARGYPYPRNGSVRHEVFTRRGGVYFGTMHLLGYPAPYAEPLYRFADFNAGWYASRNAAFQHAVAVASGRELALDGDLLQPGAAIDAPGATESALRALGPALGMDRDAIRDALRGGATAGFADSDLYQRVFAMAEARSGKPLPRARLPQIALSSPKITRKLTTAWFAERVNTRWKRCMAR